MQRVAIIGSGAVGLCTAWFAQKAGAEVTVVSAAKKGTHSGCSFGNAGMIVPSHFVPLAAPGVIRQGLKWMLDSQSPLYIRPRLNAELFAWLRHFYASANARNVECSKHLLKDLNTASRDLYADFQQSPEFDFGYERKGLLMLYNTPHCQAEEEALAERARGMGISAKTFNRQQVQDLEQAMAPEVLGGVLYESDAHVLPGTFMDQLQQALEANGVDFRYNTSVTGFDRDGDRIESIRTDTEVIEADEVVVCAGAWSAQIARQLGLKLRLQAGKGYSFTLPNPSANLVHPSILCEAKVALTPMGNALRVAGTMELCGTDTRVNPQRVAGIQQQVPRYLSAVDKSWFNGLETWVGLRPVSPDGLPYLGRAEGWKNLSLNTGHAMMGMSLAPISGQLMAQILRGDQPALDLSLLNPNRF